MRAVIQRGADIDIVPELPGCRFNPKRASFTWLKDWHRVEFDLRADPAEPGFVLNSPVRGRVAFYVGPVLVGEVRFWTDITDTADTSSPRTPGVPATSAAYRAIFVSYARKDAKVVSALERAYMVLGDRYLRDVHDLRAGENWNPALLQMIERADVFQLCWSYAAKKSDYVKREWKHALIQDRPAPFIRPT